ncbi:GNAT family N-acetyltransferase [Kangiella marina]|uniref:GNAT family N-acetyltransferase n=1 Tax=Kangiella marina TaxID=1079178 RepID=A0ABP8IBL1_9GAMM
MNIKVDDLKGPEIAQLLNQHLEEMRATSPPESKHALDLNALRSNDITFWTLWDNDKLAGCIALKKLDERHAEIKSMRTAPDYARRGVATRLLEHLILESQKQGYHRLSLETGSMPYFNPARQLYQKHGFKLCEPFADYREDPNSVFMTKSLDD